MEYYGQQPYQGYPYMGMQQQQPTYYGQMQQQKPAQTILKGINWVDGIDEINRTDLPLGEFAVFFDKNQNGVMYIKSRDSLGLYSLKTFKYEEVTNESQNSEYVKKSELKQLFDEWRKEEMNERLVSEIPATN